MCIKADCYQLLLKHIPSDSSAYAALQNAIEVEGSIDTVDEYWVECTAAEAMEFARTARNHFPHRAAEIDHAILTAVR